MRPEIRKLQMYVLLAVFFLIVSLMFATTAREEPKIFDEPPVASFTYEPTNPVASQTITFDASSSYDLDGRISSYAWDFGDGLPSIIVKRSYIKYDYASAGTYVVTLTVWDDKGASGSKRETISVGAAWYPWPMFGHYASRNGTANISGPRPFLALDWNFPTGYEIYSSPAVGVDGTIYIGTYDAYPADIPKLYAINPDGTEKWRFLTTHYGKIDSSPAIGPDGTIYIATHEEPCTRVAPPCPWTGNACPDFFAINSDGTEKWHLCLWPDPTLPSPGDCLNPACGWDLVEYSDLAVTVEDGMSVIYVGSWYGYLYRIEDHGTHGEIAWHRLVSPIEGAPLLFAPAVGSDNTIYIGTVQLPLFGGGDLWAINSDGSDKWTTPVHLTTAPGEAVAAPAVEIVDREQSIYVGTTDNQMCKVVDMGTYGEHRWTCRAGGDIVCSPSVKDLNDDGMADIVFGSFDNNVYAITDRGNNWGNNVIDGIPLWTFATRGDVLSSPVIDKFGSVYIGSDDGNVYAISNDGTNTFSYATNGPVRSSAAISKCSWPSGISWRLYVGSNDGNLYSLRGIDLRVAPYSP